MEYWTSLDWVISSKTRFNVWLRCYPSNVETFLTLSLLVLYMLVILLVRYLYLLLLFLLFNRHNNFRFIGTFKHFIKRLATLRVIPYYIVLCTHSKIDIIISFSGCNGIAFVAILSHHIHSNHFVNLTYL